MAKTRLSTEALGAKVTARNLRPNKDLFAAKGQHRHLFFHNHLKDGTSLLLVETDEGSDVVKCGHPILCPEPREDSSTMNALMLLDVPHERMPTEMPARVEQREEEEQGDIPPDKSMPVDSRGVVQAIEEGTATGQKWNESIAKELKALTVDTPCLTPITEQKLRKRVAEAKAKKYSIQRIPSMMIFVIKVGGKHKSRLVACGNYCSQTFAAE
eukprot:2444006-Amphidinium_carterae.2